MFGHSLRASRQLLARAARPQNAAVFRRTILTPTAARQVDLVQEMYLKELKAYKAPPTKASDAEGQVLKFHMPAPPSSPEEADISSSLAEYEKQIPEVEGQAGSTGASDVESDWFEEPEEDEAPHH